jgi:hypothetical protein
MRLPISFVLEGRIYFMMYLISACQESLFLTYTPSYHGTFNLYKDTETKPYPREATRIQVSQILKVSKPTTNLLLHQQPEVMSVGTTANIIPQMHKGLNGAIDEIGGIGVFLFLYARVGISPVSCI